MLSSAVSSGALSVDTVSAGGSVLASGSAGLSTSVTVSAAFFPAAAFFLATFASARWRRRSNTSSRSRAHFFISFSTAVSSSPCFIRCHL